MGWAPLEWPIPGSKVVVYGGEWRIDAHKTRPFVVDMLELDSRFSLSKVIVCGAF